MTKFIAGLFLGLTISAAIAQGIDWSHGACYDNGVWFAARSLGQCFSEDKAKGVQTFPPPLSPEGTLSATVSIVTATSARTLKCPDGYELVYTSRPMCARDLREPE
jgi:hypothetical protein